MPLAQTVSGSPTKAEVRRVSPAKFAHAVLRTRDNYDAMVNWYETVLEADIVYRNAIMAFVRFDDEHHRLLIVNAPDAEAPAGKAIGLDHLSYTYASLGDLLATYERLKAKGIEPFCTVDHGITTAMYFRDPDGNRIELQVDNFEEMGEAVAFMLATFDVNPVGKLFDPDDYLRRYKAGDLHIAQLKPDAGDGLAPPAPELIQRLIGS